MLSPHFRELHAADAAKALVIRFITPFSATLSATPLRYAITPAPLAPFRRADFATPAGFRLLT
jgi:hypothetical protein